MKKGNTQKKFLFFFFGATLIALALYVLQNKIKYKLSKYYLSTKSKKRPEKSPCENCEILFTDGIPKHSSAYKKEGIRAGRTDADLNRLRSSGILVEINSSDDYIVRDMPHAKPFLLPKAVNFLNELSDRYKQSIEENNIEYIPFEITSATRSMESVDRLQKVNENAIKNSPHLKGKTLDISYTNFADQPEQRKIFINTLQRLKKEKRCFVKYENNGCLHITVN